MPRLDLERPAPGDAPRRWPSRVALTLLFVLIALAFAEGLVRVLGVLLARVPIVVTDARAGWANAPGLNHKTVVVPLGRFTLSTDSRGRRVSDGAARASASAPQVVLVGDSFVYGYGVDDEQTVGAILSRETPSAIVNLGVPGYGTDQELVKLEEFLDADAAPMRAVIVFLFDNDFVDVQWDHHPDLGHSKPRFQVRGGLMRTTYAPGLADRLMDVSRLFWLVNSKRSALFKTHPRPADGVDVVIACVQAMRRRVEARGAAFRVLLHHMLKPGRVRGRRILDARTWERVARDTGAVDITEDLLAGNGPDPIGPDGGHWSPAGHQRVAATIESKILAPLRAASQEE